MLRTSVQSMRPAYNSLQVFGHYEVHPLELSADVTQKQTHYQIIRQLHFLLLEIFGLRALQKPISKFCFAER